LEYREKVKIKFCMELGTSTSQTCAVFSEAYGTGNEKKLCVRVAYTVIKALRGPRTILKEAVVRKGTDPLEMLKR
jgi:hypothetical protein